MNSTTKDKLVKIIGKLKDEARNGSLEAVEALHAVGCAAAQTLQALAGSGFTTPEAIANVKKVAEDNLVFPIYYKAIKELRTDSSDPETFCKQINLGKNSGFQLKRSTKSRSLYIDANTGFILNAFMRMQCENIEITVENALSYIKGMSLNPYYPEVILNRSKQKKHSLDSALKEAISEGMELLLKKK